MLLIFSFQVLSRNFLKIFWTKGVSLSIFIELLIISKFHLTFDFVFLSDIQLSY